MVIVAYSAAIAIGLPAFLIHPFGPITKNIAVIACLLYLTIMERR
ncbi:doxX-like family protein [Collimonas pratensis]|uniref:DoxX-like family protein n=1 Tax=Collimonas pratensis TaxID=279113 RepID=A0A127Q242_9BURK|nr:doxX-like family protein [Collimonas pratensis]